VSAEAADRTQRLAADLRAAASRAADEADGGVALVFASSSGTEGDLRLRAASGFAMADDAREAASAVLDEVKAALDGDGVRTVQDSEKLGERAAGGMWIYALRQGEWVHGALVVGTPTEGSGVCEAMQPVADQLTLRLDYERLQRECDALREGKGAQEGSQDEKSDEVLRLSEALFAQDIELLRSNEKLGKIERLKNDFIEKMSRELRTPLNSIIEAIISVMTSENDSLSEASKAAMR